MDSFIENPGFYQVAMQILGHLDMWTLTQCREVSRNWLNFVDFNQSWWQLKIRKIKTKVKFLKAYPKWNKVFYHFEHNADIDQTKYFVEFLHTFLKESGNSKYKTPFAYANQVQNWDFIQSLLSIPYDFEERLNDSSGILHTICQSGQVSLLQTVINVGILDLNITDDYGNTPLHVACCSGQYELVKLLLENNVDVNATSDDGWTPLHEAVYIESTEIVDLLLQNAKKFELKTTIEDVNGNTPLKLALENHSLEIVQLFRQYC